MSDTFSPVGIYGWGFFVPPLQSVKEMIEKSGGDPTNYLKAGWPNICVATENDYPTNMAARSLKAALADAGIDASQLKLVICTSQTHDYLELATSLEVMKEVNASTECLGFDIFDGCLATLTAFEISRGWLNVNGGGYAAIITAERRVESIDRNDKTLESIWGESDGASAVIIGLVPEKKPRLVYQGTCFHSINEMSGHMRRAYGGTRAPMAPAGTNPGKRVIGDIPAAQMQKYFVGGFGKVIDAFQARYKVKPEWLIANQVSPVVVEMLGYLTRVDSKKIAKTGAQYGHVGCSDLIIGIDHLSKSGLLAGKGMALASNPSSWGAALFETLV
jgi:3-oxoacyl-[acyl-carrier-protein] synthase III